MNGASQIRCIEKPALVPKRKKPSGKRMAFLKYNFEIDYPIFNRVKAVAVKSASTLVRYSATVLLPSFTKG